MGLTCSCDYDFEAEPGMWLYWSIPDRSDFEKFCASRRKRCCSCNTLIEIGSLCVVHPRYRYPRNGIEAKIYGDLGFDLNYEPPIKIANHYHCEKCGEIWLNLTALGYECISPNENMADNLKEYHEMIGFEPEGV